MESLEIGSRASTAMAAPGMTNAVAPAQAGAQFPQNLNCPFFEITASST